MTPSSPIRTSHGRPSRASIRRELSATARLATPVAISQIAMMAMGVVDTMMVGPLGAESIAAIAVANAVYLLPLLLSLGTVMALDPMMAQAVGAGRFERTGELLWQGMWLALLLGLVLTALFLDFHGVFVALRQEPAVARLGAGYVRLRALGAVAFLVFAVARSFLNGYGHMRPVLWIALGANIVNALADWALIYGRLGAPAMGVQGAGLATAIVRWFMVGCVAVPLLMPGYREHSARSRSPRPGELCRIVAVGAPLGGLQAVEMAVFTSVAVMSGWLGAVPQAAHQIAMTLAALAYHVPVGIAIAVSVRVGQRIGGRDPDGAALAGRVALALGGGFMILMALVFVALRSPLVRLFSPDPRVFSIATHLMLIAAVFQVSDGIQCVAGGALRGAGDTRSSLYANVFSHWLIGLPLGWALAFHTTLGIDGLWWGVTVSLTLGAVLLARRFLGERWRRIGVIV